MAVPFFRPLFLLSPLLLLGAGCADQGSFPSLAPRSVERLSNDEPVRTPPVVAADPQLSRQVASLLADARQGQAAYEAALPAARASVARAGASGSESWIAAQQAVSALEAARAPTAIALAQLDRLAVERAAQPTNEADFAELVAAVAAAEALTAAQQGEIDRLGSALRPV